MRTVHEISKLTGVSVRTLHHYDAIDLLKPTKLTPAGYRLYDDTALGRLQIILMFRELQFPLKEIKAILDSPTFDPKEALAQQIKLLELQLKHTKELISFALEIQEKGVNNMNFNAFNKTEMEQYATEIKEKWGSTTAYKEYERKKKEKSDKEIKKNAEQLMTLFSDIGTLKQLLPNDKTVQDKIKTLQEFITENYYTCTNEILKGLGQMYVCDERMKQNIDKAGGEGTAEFVKQAIMVYCHIREKN
ncbi:MAG: MerR family transcriptional regulator [Lachnospiraceae bacterium]|nr:MerR family transcriptional regulator [Lachnospiraceae bacterium]